MLPLIAYQYTAYEVPVLSAFQVDTTIPPLIDRLHETLQVALVIGILGLMVALSQATLPIGRRVDQFCGDLSYPLYLNHVLAGHVAASLYPGPLARIIHRTARNRPRPPNTWARDFIAKNFIKQPIRIVVNDINGLALIAHFS